MASASTYSYKETMPVRLLGTLWIIALVVVGLVSVIVIDTLLLPHTLLFDRKRYWPGIVFRKAGVVVFKLSGLWKCRVDGQVGSYRPGNAVVVSNHLSLLDVFVLSQVPWEMKYLSKREIIYRDSVKEAMKGCKNYMRQGMPVMLFPEGTRSKDGKMKEFKDGAFRLAIEEQADILPLALIGTDKALRKGSMLGAVADAWLRVDKPISTKGMTLDDLARLRDRVHAIIQRNVEEMHAKQAAQAGKKTQ